jgi:hypothetical protein
VTVFSFPFFLFYIFLSSFFKNTWSAKNLQNYTSSAVGDCGRDLPRGTVAPSTIVGHGGSVDAKYALSANHTASRKA